MVIDAHMHLIQEKFFDKDTYKRLNKQVPWNTDLDTLVKWMKDAGIVKAVCMGQDMDRIWNSNFGEIYNEENYVFEAAAKYPDFFIPFVSVEPLDKANKFHKEKYEYFKNAVIQQKVRGVLFTPPYGQFASNDKTAYPFYALAEDHGVIVQYHHSAALSPPGVFAQTKYTWMTYLNDVMVDFPNLKIVVEHIGYPWSEHLFTLMGMNKNIYADIAQTYKRPMWLTWNLVMAKEMGVLDRIMYASDYVAYDMHLFSKNPTDDFINWIDFVKNGLNRICKQCGWPTFSDDDINGILYNNAARLYNIK